MADPLDLVSWAEARDELGLRESATEDDAALRSLITGVSRMIDDETGPVVTRSVIEVVDGLYPRLDASFWPVASVTRVRESTSTPDDDPATDPDVPGSVVGGYVTLDPSDYRTERFRATGNYHRWLLRLGGCWASRVELSYEAGRFAGTADVDPRFKQAALLALHLLWDRYRPTYTPETGELSEGSFRIASFGMPNAARDILGQDLRHRVGR